MCKYMENEQLNLDAYEQLYLLNIESQNKMSTYHVENFCTHTSQHTATFQDLSSIIDLLTGYEEYFLSYEPIAQRLDKIGRTELSKKLGEILSDIRGTLTIFRGVRQKILGTDKKVEEDTLINH